MIINALTNVPNDYILLFLEEYIIMPPKAVKTVEDLIYCIMPSLWLSRLVIILGKNKITVSL